VRLFVERARALQPGFRLTAENGKLVAAICALVDGLPLAIELAAARVRLLPLPVLLEQLRRGPALLSGGDQDLPARQRTLLATIRQFAQERLSESGEADAVSRRHAEHLVRLAEQAGWRPESAGYSRWMRRMADEHDNIRAALSWTRSEGGDRELGLRLAGRLYGFWHVGRVREGRAWL